MKLLDTVAAVGTPYGKGGVAMIRISGADAIEIGDRIFRPASGKALSEVSHARMVYGEIVMPNGDGLAIDDGMAVAFYAPHSFTGEDTVEITCHGGILVTRKVLSAALAAGARMAEAGEFTRRAYLSGKMKLSQAEALGELLDAGSETQLLLARNGMRGTLSTRLEELYASLRDVLTSVFAAMDFPDEDLSEMSREEMITALGDVLEKTRRLAATYRTGRAVTEGIPTVICGRANAGKSSVYNRILGYDAAIVTDIAGTTRDVLRETAVLGRTTLRLCDTAGLRETDDQVESIGIERTWKELSDAELILAVFDRSSSPTDEDIALARRIAKEGKTAIALLNKNDRGSDRTFDLPLAGFSHVLEVSALTGDGFDALAEAVDGLFLDGTINMSDDAVVTGARQYAALERTAEAIESAVGDLLAGVSLDLCCIGVEQAMAALGEVDGREISEDVVSAIFSKFCVGK